MGSYHLRNPHSLMADIKKRRENIDAATNPSITDKSVKTPLQSESLTRMMPKLDKKRSFKDFETAPKTAETRVSRKPTLKKRTSRASARVVSLPLQFSHVEIR